MEGVGLHCQLLHLLLANFVLSITVYAVNLRLYNACPFTIWPAWLSNDGKSQISGGGTTLRPYSYYDLSVPYDWAGRAWARRGCNFNNGGGCSVGDCNRQLYCNGIGGTPPVTLVEFTLAGHSGQDFYDVSLVDGYNLPVRIYPTSGCASAGCYSDVNSNCPQELRVYDNSGVVGCKSACLAFGYPQYCCTGQYGSPNTCRPTEYSKIFKAACPEAYSYAYDDESSTFTCPQGGGYTITFCP